MNIKTTTVWVVKDFREIKKGRGIYLRILNDGLLEQNNMWLVIFDKKDRGELVPSRNVYISEGEAEKAFTRERENQIQWYQREIATYTEKLNNLQKP